MSDVELVRETAARIMTVTGKRSGAAGSLDVQMARELAETGLDRLAVPEAAGGSGGTLEQAVAVVLEAGRAAAAVPVVETALLAGWLCGRAGLTLPPGTATVIAAGPRGSVRADPVDGGWRIDGSAARVPWASAADSIVVVVPTDVGCVVLVVPGSSVATAAGANLAGEPRDTVRLDGVTVPDSAAAVLDVDLTDQVLLRGALGRTVLVAGALQTMLTMTRGYVVERVQFGRPLAAFQVVKQQVAELAGEVAATSVAAHAAAQQTTDEPAPFVVAAAKIAAARGATTAAAIAHQLHGAIGFTEEHSLHLFTQRVLSWRDEYGTQSYWESRLGRQVTGAGADALWPTVTGAPATGSGTAR